MSWVYNSSIAQSPLLIPPTYSAQWNTILIVPIMKNLASCIILCGEGRMTPPFFPTTGIKKSDVRCTKGPKKHKMRIVIMLLFLLHQVGVKTNFVDRSLILKIQTSKLNQYRVHTLWFLFEKSTAPGWNKLSSGEKESRTENQFKPDSLSYWRIYLPLIRWKIYALWHLIKYNNIFR